VRVQCLTAEENFPNHDVVQWCRTSCLWSKPQRRASLLLVDVGLISIRIIRSVRNLSTPVHTAVPSPDDDYHHAQVAGFVEWRAGTWGHGEIWDHFNDELAYIWMLARITIKDW